MRFAGFPPTEAAVSCQTHPKRKKDAETRPTSTSSETRAPKNKAARCRRVRRVHVLCGGTTRTASRARSCFGERESILNQSEAGTPHSPIAHLEHPESTENRAQRDPAATSLLPATLPLPLMRIKRVHVCVFALVPLVSSVFWVTDLAMHCTSCELDVCMRHPSDSVYSGG